MQLRALLSMAKKMSATFVDAVSALTNPVVNVVGVARDSDELVVMTEHLRPDVIFHDPFIDNGETLKSWKQDFGQFPALVCVTNELFYAVDAFEAGAVHYLVSPFNRDSVTTAVNRVATKCLRHRSERNGDYNHISEHGLRGRILTLPSQSGIDVRSVDEVVCVNGEGNYVRVVLSPDGSLLLSRSLGDLEKGLEDAGLLRVHRSHMVNVNHIRQLKRGKSPILRMSNGDEIDVSTRYRDTVMDLLRVRIARK